jgi:hypothetical protein
LRFVLPLLLFGSSLMTDGWAQRKGASQRTSTAISMKSATEGTISVSFVSAPDGAALIGGASGQRNLDLGAVSHAGGTHTPNVQVQKLPGHFVVSTKFGLSIQDGSQRASTATVLAALAVPDPSFAFRLDGITLQTAPQLLQGQARVGPTLIHRLEIDVPASVTEKNSQLHNAIIFQIIPN